MCICVLMYIRSGNSSCDVFDLLATPVRARDYDGKINTLSVANDGCVKGKFVFLQQTQVVRCGCLDIC